MKVTVSGRTVRAATGGVPFDPARPVVMLIHGAGMDGSVWALQARALTLRGYAVVAVDLPGHGGSDGPPSDSIAALADWVPEFLDAVGIADAGLAGHSMGALVALETAARHPDRVRALGLLGAAGRMPVHPDLLAAAARDPRTAASLIVGWSLSKRARLGGAGIPGYWLPGLVLAQLTRAPHGVLATDLSACNDYDGGAGAAAAVRCPTLVLVGAMDRMSPPAAGRALAAAISGSQLITLEGVGHMMMAEDPNAATAALALIDRP